MNRVLGLIPARGGSKTIPLKNLARLAGRPLIAYTIEAALGAPALERIVVSTDSEEIAAVAGALGAEVPFLRPRELARDDTPRAATIRHAVEWLKKHQNYSPDMVVTLQPTSPLRTPADIQAAIELALAREADEVVSVCPAHHHPYWTRRIDPDGRLIDWLPQTAQFHRRQDLPPAYALNGAIFLARREVLLNSGNGRMARTFAYVMPAERSLDIDSPWDLRLAELILSDAQYVAGN